MRDIKFKYWWLFENSFVEQVFTIHQIEHHAVMDYVCGDDFPSYPLISGKCQWTGLQDKSGVDIYEGDIVKAVSNKHYWLSVISADNGKNGNINLYAMEFCNNVTSCEFEEVYTYERQDSTRRNDINTRMEIIGNIHSNPELLEK